MAPRSRAAKALQPLFADGHVCLSCRRNLQRSIPHPRSASAATAEATPSSAETSEPPPTTIDTAQAQFRPTYQLHAGIVLSRAPTLTRPLLPFERAFFLYQRRLNERLALPFTRYFYFKKGTPADLEWKRKVKERNTPARDIGVYNPYAKEGWDDEIRVGDKLGEELEEETRRRLIRDAQGDVVGITGGAEAGVGAAPELLESGEPGASKSDHAQKAVDPVALVPSRRRGQDVERPMDRTTQADREGNMKSLDRAGSRTLYLLVKSKDGAWKFPSSRLAAKENVRQGVERILEQSAGRNMNTWFVGNQPIGHCTSTYRKVLDNVASKTRDLGEKVFFLKGRIMAGQADLTKNALGLQEHKWLTKEEVKDHVTSKYFAQVENMLAER